MLRNFLANIFVKYYFLKFIHCTAIYSKHLPIEQRILADFFRNGVGKEIDKEQFNAQKLQIEIKVEIKDRTQHLS